MIDSSCNDFLKTQWGHCVVPNCTTLNSFGFFKFPKKQEKCDLWLQLCGLHEVNEEDRICANHFLRSDLCLKKTAYPTLNLHNDKTDETIVEMKGK